MARPGGVRHGLARQGEVNMNNLPDLFYIVYLGVVPTIIIAAIIAAVAGGSRERRGRHSH